MRIAVGVTHFLFASAAAANTNIPDEGLQLLQVGAAKKAALQKKEEFSCDLCADSENEFDATGKKGKCQRIYDRAQKNSKRCEKRKNRPGVIRGCCPDPPVECDICAAGSTLNGDNLDGKCAKIATRSTKNEELCNKIKGRKRVQKKCCETTTTTTAAPNLLESKCHCNLAADQDIDNVYIDGVDKTDTLESTLAHHPVMTTLGDPKIVKILRFQCTAATKIAVKASDGNVNAFTKGGCKTGGFAMKCVTDDQRSVWHQYRTDLGWKAKGFACEGGDCKWANLPGSHKNTFIPTPPSNWFANDFDDSDWEAASEGIPHTVSAKTGSDISICATGGPGWLFRGGATECHAESLDSCTATA